MRLASLRHQGLAAVIAQVASAVLGALALWIGSMLVPPEEFGQFLFALAIATPIHIVTDLGLNAIYQRRVAIDPTNRLGALLISRALLLAAVGILVLVAWTFSWSRSLILNATTTWILGLVLLATVVGIFRTAFEWTWQARRETLPVESLRLGEATVFIVALLLLLAFDIPGALLAIAGAFLASRVVGLVLTLWRAASVGDLPTRPVRGDVKGLLVATVPATPMFSFNAAILAVDFVVLAVFATSREIGLYGIAMRIASICAITGIALASVLLPRFATLHAVGDRRTMDRMVVLSHRFLLITAIPMSLALLIFPSHIAAVFFDSAYAGAAASLRWLSLFVLASSLAHPYSSRLLGEARLGSLAAVTGGHLVALLLLLLTLTPRYGAPGAAAAVAVASTSGPIVMAILAKRLQWQVGLTKQWRVLAGGLLLAGLWIGIRLLPLSDLQQIIMAVVVGIAYLGLLFALRFLDASPLRAGDV